jgi:hypothetical protein
MGYPPSVAVVVPEAVLLESGGPGPRENSVIENVLLTMSREDCRAIRDHDSASVSRRRSWGRTDGGAERDEVRRGFISACGAGADGPPTIEPSKAMWARVGPIIALMGQP